MISDGSLNQANSGKTGNYFNIIIIILTHDHAGMRKDGAVMNYPKTLGQEARKINKSRRI